jgi:Domain of unknown function (DUF305)
MKGRHTMSPTRFSLKLRAGAVAFVVASSLAWARHGSLLAQDHSPQDICTTFDSARSAEAQFLAENTEAMNKMMSDMALKPTGDIDSDFVAMMVPHHQGAIDMALAVLRYGSNAQIRRLAQEIIVTQQQEIVAMRLAVGQPLSPTSSAPAQASPASTPHTGTEP